MLPQHHIIRTTIQLLKAQPIVLLPVYCLDGFLQHLPVLLCKQRYHKSTGLRVATTKSRSRTAYLPTHDLYSKVGNLAPKSMQHDVALDDHNPSNLRIPHGQVANNLAASMVAARKFWNGNLPSCLKSCRALCRLSPTHKRHRTERRAATFGRRNAPWSNSGPNKYANITPAVAHSTQLAYDYVAEAARAALDTAFG